MQGVVDESKEKQCRLTTKQAVLKTSSDEANGHYAGHIKFLVIDNRLFESA